MEGGLTMRYIDPLRFISFMMVILGLLMIAVATISAADLLGMI